MRISARTMLLAGGALALANGAAAQEAEVTFEDPYASCAAITGDDAARLRCFDATYANQITVRADAEAARIAREAAEEARREEEFGLNVFQRREARADEIVEQEGETREAAEAIVAAEEAEDEVEIVSVVTEVFEDGARRQVVLLANGMMWRETSNSTIRRRIRAGWTARLEESFSGGFRMRFDEQSGYMGVTRVR